LLGINHVAPAKPIAIPYQQLIDAAEPSHRTYVAERFADAIVRNGVVYGEVQWWLPRSSSPRSGAIGSTSTRARTSGTSTSRSAGRFPPEYRALCEQLSALIVFDVLIDNADRWSGANTMMSPDASTLFFMDNTLSFSIHRFGHEIPNTALRRIEVFPRGLIARLRDLTYEAIRARARHGR